MAAPTASDISINRERAIAIARGGNVSAPAFARLVERKDVGTLDRGLGENALVNPERMTWVVTVHADLMTRGAPAVAPVKVHWYTVAIDAATGQVTDMCYGCDTIQSAR